MDTRNLLIGDIIFVRGHLSSVVDDAIKLAETIEDKTPFTTNYSHVAVYIRNDTVAEAQWGRISGPAPLSTYEGNYDVGTLQLSDTQRQAIVIEAQKLYGMRYDKGMIAEIGLEALTGLDIHRHDTLEAICSVYVVDVFKNATGILLSDKDKPTPEDIAINPLICIKNMVE